MMQQIFLDCDGVLADFNLGAEEIFGMSFEAYEAIHGYDAAWGMLRTQPNFFGSLSRMPDAMELFNAVKHLNPVILTGCPSVNGEWAEPQKLAWRDRHFPGVPMVTTLSRDKRHHGQPGDILIDDYLKYKDLWLEMGGIFIHHTSAKDSIKELIRVMKPVKV